MLAFELSTVTVLTLGRGKMSLLGRSRTKETKEDQVTEVIRIIRSAETPMFVGLSRIQGAQNRRKALSRVVDKAR
jgi:hypothetical protein